MPNLKLKLYCPEHVGIIGGLLLIVDQRYRISSYHVGSYHPVNSLKSYSLGAYGKKAMCHQD